jgi:vacuolar-type H+-ATPase subunit I/STV1
MSILSGSRGREPAMPKNTQNVAPLPRTHNQPPLTTPPRPAPSIQESYAEEALRAAQRAIDQVREIERLSQEVADWQRQALLGQAEIKRLEAREAQLIEQLDRRTNELTEERDSYRFRLNNLEAQFEAAGSIILKCLEAAKGAAATRGMDLRQLEETVERAQQAHGATAHDMPPRREPGESGEPVRQSADDMAPIPRVVAAGPRNLDEDKG